MGSTFADLAGIIDQVVDKSRVGVCLDTAHLWGAGYDISTRDAYDATMRAFEKAVGFRYLKAMHINDSKVDLNSKRDRHENIGKGKIGLKAFQMIMNDSRLNGMPLVLETPVENGEEIETYKREIELLYSLVSA